MGHAVQEGGRPKSAIAMRVECVLAIAAAMFAAEAVARALDGGLLQNVASAGSVLLSGYLGGVVYLLQHASHIGRWTRVRLVVSLLTPPAVGVMALTQPMSSEACGVMLIFGTLAALPLLWLAAHDVARGLRGLPPETYSFDDGDKSWVIASMAWSLSITSVLLYVVANALDLGKSALYVAGILAVNGGAELGVLAWGLLWFLRGGVEEMGNTLFNGSHHGTATSDNHRYVYEDDDSSDFMSLDDSDSGPRESLEMKMYNPSTGCEMMGALDSAGYMLGEDPSHSSSFDSDSSFDSSSWSSSMHDS